MFDGLIKLANNLFSVWKAWVVDDKAKKITAYRGRNVERRLRQKDRLERLRQAKAKK